MVERRWLQRLGPPAAGALAVALVAGTSIGAADGTWEPPACPGEAEAVLDAAAATSPVDAAATARGWFTLDPQLDATGTLSGQRLRIGGGRERTRSIPVPPESAAAGPFGRVILVAADDGVRSTIGAVDTAARCRWELGTSTDVVRAVTLARDGSAIYEFRVERATRADLGVWRRALDGAAPTRVAPPPDRDARSGPTFVTTLGWTAEGDELVVQSCGAVVCRVRLVDPATGVVTAVPGRHGELVGVAAGRAVAYEPCLGLPCAVGATDIASGRRVTLAADAGLARLVATPGGARVAVQPATDARRVHVHRLDGSLEDVVSVPDNLALMPVSERALAGAAPPDGWLVLAPDGRSPDGAILTRLVDGATVEVREVLR